MSALSNFRVSSPKPDDYVTPEFPSLYWPFPIYGKQARYLYDADAIVRFTILWTLIFFAALHITTSGYACLIQWRNWKLIWVTPLIYAIIGGIEAIVAGSVVGGLLSAIYISGRFNMSTWVPFIWAWINSVILIMSSFALQGGL